MANVGPAFEQRRRHARRHFGRKRLLGQRSPRAHALGIIAEENADGIFLLADLSLEVRNLRVGGIQHLLGLQHVQLGGHAVVEPQLRQLDGIFLGLHGVARDLEFEIELQEREVVARHVADEREYDRMLAHPR